MNEAWKMTMRALAAGVLTAASAGLLTGCHTNAATGNSFISLMGRDDQIKVGAEAAPQFTDQFGGKVPNQQLQGYVTDLGSRMAAITEADNPSLPWEFTLLNSDVINAFALPGGKVFITRGLAGKLENEAQMAGVIGHEIGHVTAEHGARRISNTQLFNIGLAGAAIAVGVADEDSNLRKYGQYGVPALAVGGNLVLLKYGRDEESQADSLGMRYMSRVGYDPSAQRKVMEILQRESEGGSREVEFLSTHPYPETRIQRIDKLLSTEYASTQNNPQYQLHADRYQRDFLRPLAALPPAPAPPPAPTAMGDGDPAFLLLALSKDAPASGIILGDPSTWCSHCAAKKREHPSGLGH